jgi:hypothetical protein
VFVPAFMPRLFHLRVPGTLRRAPGLWLRAGTTFGVSTFLSDTEQEISDMTLTTKLLAAAAIGSAALSFSALNASAAIACVGPVCWHSHEAYEYPPSAGVVVHGDDWRWGLKEHYSWREHEGRGYWKGDSWTAW